MGGLLAGQKRLMPRNSANAGIRKGVPRDQEWCAQLMAGSEPWITLRQDLRTCREKCKRPGTELFVCEELAAAREKQPVHLLGFILLAPFGFAGMPYVSSIGVASEERGRGFGADLLRFAEKHFAGRSRLYLLVSSFNIRAQEFYRREGFEFQGELKDFIVAGHSELIYCKRVS